MKKGFTLIELLVVVLIIGILSAIALPQYEKAVEKSRATQALAVLRSFFEAQQRVYLSNGAFTNSLADLDLDMSSFNGTTRWYDGVAAKSNEYWSLQTNSGYQAVYMGRISGPYKGAGFMVAYKLGTLPTIGDIYCVERTAAGLLFQKEAGSYCQKVMGAKFSKNVSNGRAYLMP